MLVVIDLQERLLPAIAGSEALLENVRLLCRAAEAVGVPLIGTTQNAARLGPVVNELMNNLRSAPIIDKMTFSCAQAEAFGTALAACGRRQVLLCGVETHICISQTAHDLLEKGFQVHVAADAVSSRSVERHKLGMERIRDAGILPVSAEAAVYEWLETAESNVFKSVLGLVR